MTRTQRFTITDPQKEMHAGDVIIATHEGTFVVERMVPEYATHPEHHVTIAQIRKGISTSVVADENALGHHEVETLTNDVARAIGVSA